MKVTGLNKPTNQLLTNLKSMIMRFIYTKIQLMCQTQNLL